MGKDKIAPLTTPTPLNRQSPNNAYVITSAIFPTGHIWSRSCRRLLLPI